MDPSPALAVFGGQWLLAETGAVGMVKQEPVLWDCLARPSTSRSMMGIYDGSVPPTRLSQEKQTLVPQSNFNRSLGGRGGFPQTSWWKLNLELSHLDVASLTLGNDPGC